jgi:hypothetical protein
MKTIKLFLWAAFTATSIFMYSQPQIAWQNNYGSIKDDYAYDIKQTNDGGFIFTGYVLSRFGDVSESHGQQEFWVVKTDSDGVIEWERTFGGSSYERAYSIQQTSDNGYIVAGVTASVDGDITEYFGYEDIWVLKLDSTGNLEWQKSYGDDDNELIWEILQTTDGGYVMAGNSWINNSHSDFIVKKIDPNGNLEWQNIFGYDNNGSEDKAHSIKQTSDGGYIVAGYTIVLENQLNTSDYWIVKLNSLGVIEWDSRLGGTNVDDAWNVQQTTDGGYIITGYSYSNDGDVTGNHGMEDIWVVKLNTTGSIQWQKSLGGSTHDRSYSIIQNSDGDYIVSGYTDSIDGDITNNHGSYDGWLVKLDTNGNIIWQTTVGGSGTDAFRRVIQTTDGGYAVSGRIDSEDTDSGTLQGDADCWVVTFQSETLHVNNNITTNMLNIYPNPVSNVLNIKTPYVINSLVLYDVLGNQVMHAKNTNQIFVSNYPSGLYLLKLETDAGTITKKVVIE